MIKTARAILNNSLGIKGNNPAAIAFSKPIIELKYPIPQIKIITVPINRGIIHLIIDLPNPRSAKYPITAAAIAIPYK